MDYSVTLFCSTQNFNLVKSLDIRPLRKFTRASQIRAQANALKLRSHLIHDDRAPP